MIDGGEIDKVYKIALAAVQSNDHTSRKTIEQVLQEYNKIFQLDEIHFLELQKRIESEVDIHMNTQDVLLVSEENRNWFIDTRVERGSRRSDAYEEYLKKELSNSVVSSISSSMDKAMNAIGDPVEKTRFTKKGLIIGDVQSGKTGNFIALMNKAMDAGYNMIIVTTGTIEKLRQQTQSRIEAGVQTEVRHDQQTFFVTSMDKGFKKGTNNLMSLGETPIIAVIKKNITELKALKQWLDQNSKTETIEASLLFIDDEADNASVNTKKSGDSPTAINDGIRTILDTFQKSSYVGFTGTPYANVFIDPEEERDLFPKDFIQVLPTSSEYMGPGNIFPEEGNYHDILFENDDCEKYIPMTIPLDLRKTFVVEEIPESLKEAIQVFFLQCAIRDARGQKGKHYSMLVNVSFLNHVQLQVKEKIEEYLMELKRWIKLYSLQETYEKTIDLRRLFEKHFSTIPETFESIQPTLYASVDSILTDVINSKNNSFRYEDYTNGARIIAVGGFSLSRGLTLEGLSCSYLYRNTLMYDTLMQMGRWFGYRPRYDDLIKLYMSRSSMDWYYQVYEATEDLKNQVQKMANAGKTPSDFGFYVKEAENKDEAMLLITARNKMRTAEGAIIPVRISGEIKETPHFELASVQKNKTVVENWVSGFVSHFENDEFLWKNAPVDAVEKIFSSYEFGRFNKLNENVWAVIRNSFKAFDVKIITKKDDREIKVATLNLHPRTRAFTYHAMNEVIRLGNSRLGSPADGVIGLSNEQKDKVKANSEFFKTANSYFKNFTVKERNPLVLLYPIYLNEPKDEMDVQVYKEYKDKVIWGIALGVPAEEMGENSITYRTKMNKIYQQQLIDQASWDKFVSEDEQEEEEFDNE
ncbi:MAG: Z1 domain-containing protein [Streptococcaceae bacterium]|jgi:spore coat protein CotF|nr:Z1 domain-containing protein [Streptococcaceae bacterium]